MKLNLVGVSKDAILDRNKVNNGIWIHLESSKLAEETGQTYPLFLNDDPAYPQRALVRYYRCEQIKDAEKAQQKTAMVKMRVAPKKEKEKVAVENSLLAEDVRFGLILVAFENVGAEPGTQYVDNDDARAIYDMAEYDSWVQQIRDSSTEEANYAATSETEAGNALPLQPSSQTADSTVKAEAAPTTLAN